MDQTQRLFYRTAFKIQFLQLTATAFQDLFAEIMRRGYRSDFQKVRPYGKEGDLKCDGYLSSTKTVFQCYAPRQMKERETVAKIIIDFNGAKEFWDKRMERWVFVHNDWDGLSPKVVQTLEDIKNNEKSVQIGHWSYPELVQEVDGLSLGDLAEMFGHQPTQQQIERVAFPELQDVLAAITKSDPDPEPEIRAPSLNKIDYNQLSSDTTEFLKLGRRLERSVQDFFERWPDPAFADQIAETFRQRYAALKDVGNSSEEIFVSLLRFAGFNSGPSSKYNSAVLAVITYFFERCEIFDDPNGRVF